MCWNNPPPPGAEGGGRGLLLSSTTALGVELRDQSSNGTYCNAEKVGKGRAKVRFLDPMGLWVGVCNARREGTSGQGGTTVSSDGLPGHPSHSFGFLSSWTVDHWLSGR